MSMQAHSHAHQKVGANPGFPTCHAESLQNASAIFSVSAIADRDDIVAAVRTAALLARTSGASLTVTVLDESMMCMNANTPAPSGFLESSLSSIRSKLLASRSTSRFADYALEASIASASFLKAGSISLQISVLDSISLKPATTR